MPKKRPAARIQNWFKAFIDGLKKGPKDGEESFQVGLPKDNPTGWVPLDITVSGAVPGWEYEEIAKYRDYMLVG